MVLRVSTVPFNASAAIRGRRKNFVVHSYFCRKLSFHSDKEIRSQPEIRNGSIADFFYYRTSPARNIRIISRQKPYTEKFLEKIIYPVKSSSRVIAFDSYRFVRLDVKPVGIGVFNIISADYYFVFAIRGVRIYFDILSRRRQYIFI